MIQSRQMKGSYTIILAFVLVSLLGVLSIPRLGIHFDKKSIKQGLTITFQWPNASPLVIEQQVTSVLEGALGTIQGVKQITSTSSHHSGIVTLVLDSKFWRDESSIDLARFEVASILRHLYPRFPKGVTYPLISIEGTGQQQKSNLLLSFQLSSEQTPSQLRKYFEEHIKTRFSQIDGLKSVEAYGGESRQLLVSYDPTVARTLAISEEDIAESISLNEMQGASGWVTVTNGIRRSISVASSIDSQNLINRTVKVLGGRAIKLGDICDISTGESMVSTHFRVNGKAAIQVMLKTKSQTNQFVALAEARQLIRTLGRELPTGYEIHTSYDLAGSSLDGLINFGKELVTSLLAVILTTLVIFRNWKLVLATIISIVATFSTGSLVLFIFDIKISPLSLFTPVISLGLIAGQIWIMISTYLRRVDRMFIISQIGATLIMASTFAVIWLLPEDSRTDLIDFGYIFFITQLATLAVCFWLVPSLLTRLQVDITKRESFSINFERWVSKSYLNLVAGTRRIRKLIVCFCILAFGLPIFLLPPKLNGRWKLADIYNSIFSNEWYTEKIKPYSDQILGGTMRLFVNYVYDKALYASNEQTALHVEIGMPSYAAVEQMDLALREIERRLADHKGIDRYLSEIVNGQQGSLTVYFKKAFDHGYYPYQIRSEVINISSKMSGIDWDIYGVGQGFSIDLNSHETPTFSVVLKGYNYGDLEKIAVDLQKRLLSSKRIQKVDINKVPGLSGQKDLSGFKLYMDPLYWDSYSLPNYKIYNAIQRYHTRPQPDLYRLIGDDYFGITIYPSNMKSLDLYSLKNELLPLGNGIEIKPGDHISLVKERMAPSIRKEDQQYLRTVSFEYIGSRESGGRFLDETLAIFNQSLPMGYSAVKHSLQWWELIKDKQYHLVVLSLLLVLIVAAVMFESLRQPLILVSTIFLSFSGIFTIFYLFDMDFDQGGFASFFLAPGIVSLPVMIMINEYNAHKCDKNKLHSVKLSSTDGSAFISVLLYSSGLLVAFIPILFFGKHQPFWPAFTCGIMGALLYCIFLIIAFIPAVMARK